jgi:hypothetical protein
MRTLARGDPKKEQLADGAKHSIKMSQLGFAKKLFQYSERATPYRAYTNGARYSS